jgi:hypothetical protein
MFLMYADEADQVGSDQARHFIYGAVFIAADKAAASPPPSTTFEARTASPEATSSSCKLVATGTRVDRGASQRESRPAEMRWRQQRCILGLCNVRCWSIRAVRSATSNARRRETVI